MAVVVDVHDGHLLVVAEPIAGLVRDGRGEGAVAVAEQHAEVVRRARGGGRARVGDDVVAAVAVEVADTDGTDVRRRDGDEPRRGEGPVPVAEEDGDTVDALASVPASTTTRSSGALAPRRWPVTTWMGNLPAAYSAGAAKVPSAACSATRTPVAGVTPGAAPPKATPAMSTLPLPVKSPWAIDDTPACSTSVPLIDATGGASKLTGGGRGRLGGRGRGERDDATGERRDHGATTAMAGHALFPSCAPARVAAASRGYPQQRLLAKRPVRTNPRLPRPGHRRGLGDHEDEPHGQGPERNGEQSLDDHPMHALRQQRASLRTHDHADAERDGAR